MSTDYDKRAGRAYAEGVIGSVDCLGQHPVQHGYVVYDMGIAVFLFRGDPFAEHFLAVFVQNDSLDLGAAQIHACLVFHVNGDNSLSFCTMAGICSMT